MLNYTEEEVWDMTLGKLIVLFREWKKDHGYEDEDKELTKDDVISF